MRDSTLYELSCWVQFNTVYTNLVYTNLVVFLRDSTNLVAGYLKRDDLDNLEMEVRNCWWYHGGACCRLTVTGITVLHMLNLFMQCLM